MKDKRLHTAVLLVILSMLVGINAVLAGNSQDADAETDSNLDASPVVTRVVEDGVFAETLLMVKEGIVGRGINISNTLQSADMLERTGPAFGIDKPLLKNGEMVEFCSARISHDLIQADINNIVLCPFVISVYELTAEPGRIYMSFRKPYVINEASQAPTEAIHELLLKIIEEAAAW